MERTKGKMRPSRTRSSDLVAIEAGAKPSAGRTAHGHFAAGNPIGMGARWKAAIKKTLGSRAAPGDAAVVAADARCVSGGILRSLPSDAAPVRGLVSLHARHLALNAYYTAKAEAAGLDTPEGLKFLEVADRQSQRAERTLISAEDVARVHATSAKANPHEAIEAAAAELEAP